MSERRIRVLIVDDSAVIRAMLCDRIAQAADMEVVGTASGGRQALEMTERLRPDVVTLDVRMPDMDGLSALDALLENLAVPVIMVSALTRVGADIALEALDRGAVDYLAKPDRTAETSTAFGEDLLRKIRTAAGTNVLRMLEIRRERSRHHALSARRGHPAKESAKVASQVVSADLADKCIAIGISTGGPPALSSLFEAIQPPMPPIVVVQHMPPRFTEALAARLNAISALSIRQAAHGDVLGMNHVFIAPGGKHLRLCRHGRSAKVTIFEAAAVSGHRPSIDVMMLSAAKIFGPRCLGMIMTGMGRDGVDGCIAIRGRGGYVLGQDEESSDVYGMNKVAYVEGGVDRQFALDEAANVVLEQVKRLWPRSGGPAKDARP